jgi:hypothetical protein
MARRGESLKLAELLIAAPGVRMQPFGSTPSTPASVRDFLNRSRLSPSARTH